MNIKRFKNGNIVINTSDELEFSFDYYREKLISNKIYFCNTCGINPKHYIFDFTTHLFYVLNSESKEFLKNLNKNKKIKLYPCSEMECDKIHKKIFGF